MFQLYKVIVGGAGDWARLRQEDREYFWTLSRTCHVVYLNEQGEEVNVLDLHRDGEPFEEVYWETEP